MKRVSALALGLAAMLVIAAPAVARDSLHIVGSSTVYPFSTTVTEALAKQGALKSPVVEATGTGGGFKLFCEGVGEATPDIAGASRQIKDSEIATCAQNGVAKITEIPIGHDGIVIANAKGGPDFNVTRTQLFLALAKTVPQPGGTGGSWSPIPIAPGTTSIRRCRPSASKCWVRRRPPAPAMPSSNW